MSNGQCATYLELLELSKTVWESDDDSKVHGVRQKLLDHLIDSCEVTEDDIAHLR